MSAHWSRRRGLFEQIVLPIFLLRPVRCVECRKRRYVFYPIGRPILRESSFRIGFWVVATVALVWGLIIFTAR